MSTKVYFTIAYMEDIKYPYEEIGVGQYKSRKDLNELVQEINKEISENCDMMTSTYYVDIYSLDIETMETQCEMTISS